jgi:hypothetical protein
MAVVLVVLAAAAAAAAAALRVFPTLLLRRTTVRSLPFVAAVVVTFETQRGLPRRLSMHSEGRGLRAHLSGDSQPWLAVPLVSESSPVPASFCLPENWVSGGAGRRKSLCRRVRTFGSRAVGLSVSRSFLLHFWMHPKTA